MIASVTGGRRDWRPRMRAELLWILLAKLAALTLLWGLFFSAAHRVSVDGRSLSRRLGVPPSPSWPRSRPTIPPDEASRA